MGKGEIFRSETACFEQGNGEGVAHHQCRGGRRRRGQVQRAGFMLDACVEVDLGGLGQRRLGVAGQADQLDAQALDQRQQGDYFRGRAGVRQGQDDVVPGNHAHVAMAGFRRVDEEGRGTGACQGRGNLVADVPGLAHAEHDHAALAGQNHLASAYEICVDMGQQAFYGFYFEADGALCRLNQVAGLAHVRNRIAR